MPHRTIAGFYKRAAGEYKNILIFSFDRFSTRNKQGEMPLSPRSVPFSESLCQPCVSLLMADCVRHNRSFPPTWAQISVISLRKQRHGNT